MSRLLQRVVGLRFKYVMARNASSYLIEDPKYSFLKDLGLDKKNVGVFNGKWEANGPVCIDYLIFLHNLIFGSKRINAHFLD